MRVSLSRPQRLELFRLVKALPGVQFEELLFTLDPPAGTIPQNVVGQGDRTKALLGWSLGPTGCGLTTFLQTLDAIAPGMFKLESPPPHPPETAPKSSPNYTVELMGEVPLQMVYVPQGLFLMGSPETEPKRYEDEGPQHKVTISAFSMGKYPITQRQWRVVSLLDPVDIPLKHAPSKFKGDDLPVERVSWHDALEFCKRLSQHTGDNYRLPSEAEWEYTCRAARDGTSVPFNVGDEITKEQANFGRHYGQTTSIDTFSPNAFGLYAMHGNVREWCEDVWHDDYKGAPTDGSAWVKGGNQNLRILRGGCWGDDSWSCRSAYRTYYTADICDDFIGFRVCCSAPRALR